MIHASVRIAILISLALLLMAQALFLPLAVVVVFVTMWLSLWINYRKNATPLRKVWAFALTLTALASIYLSYKTLIGVDAGVAVLSTFLFAKALETKNKRDVIILFNFALFVSASCFLLSQSFAMAVMILLCLMTCLMGMYRLQHAAFEQKNSQILPTLKQDLGHVTKFLLYALPFFVLLFMFFPRLPPLWHIPIPENKGVTGISDSMSPGDIAELSQSTALAFRILGNMQQLPPRSELYWRAMVLDEYDGARWSSSFFNQQPLATKTQLQIQQHKRFDYQYLAADPKVLWVMALEKSLVLEPRYQLRQDWSITPRRLTARSQPIELRWVGQASTQLDANQQRWLMRLNTKRIADRDPQAQKLAQQLFRDSGQNPEQYIEKVLKWFQQQGFAYSLTPGTLGQHRVDEFLFQSKQGFCEHYASSFALLMRYVGIPARVVVGYQGGQLALDQKSWEVRQLDAHAWTEVYLQGVWQRFDPTAMIAPQRIDAGMQDYMEIEGHALANQQSAWAYRHYTLLKKMRIWSDYANYQWQSKVVGYNAESQQHWLKKLGLNSHYASVLILIGSLLGVLALYFIGLYVKKYRSQSEIQRVIQRFVKQLNPEQQKYPSESFAAWMQRLSLDLDLEQQKPFQQAAQYYNQQVYSAPLNSENIHFLNSLLKICANVLKSKNKSCQ